MDSIELAKLPASHTQHKTQKIWLFFLKELLKVLICSHVLPQVSWKNKIIKLYAIQSLAFRKYTLQHMMNNCSRNKGFCVYTVPLKNKLPVESCFLCDENQIYCKSLAMSFTKKSVSSFDMYSYHSHVAATFANKISTTSVKIQLGIQSRNNVSLINLFYIAFLYSHYLIYERKLSWI